MNNKGSIFSFFIVVLFLTRLVPLNAYSVVMNMALAAFFLFNSNAIMKNCRKTPEVGLVFAATTSCVLLLVIYSVSLGNEIGLIARFALILFLIMSAYLVSPSESYISIFLFFITIQALLVIGMEGYLVLNFDIDSYLPIRHVIKKNGWGDVYTFNGVFWRIQLIGSALLPFALFVSVAIFSGLKRVVFCLLFSSAIICAGNFAFVLGVVIFLLMYWVYNLDFSKRKVVISGGLFLLLIIVTIFPSYSYIERVIKEKSISSNPIRIDQAVVLINDMSEEVSTVVFGKGLGSTVDIETDWRDYSGDIYFELQALYFLNQMGVLLFTAFILLNVFFAWYFIRHKLLLITYFSYIFYASFNPYFLDTNHVVVIIVLLSLRKVLDGKNILVTRGV